MQINSRSTRKEVFDAYKQLLVTYKKLLIHCADQADQLYIEQKRSSRRMVK